eukprot:763999-Hanusia_phi.AAC.1
MIMFYGTACPNFGALASAALDIRCAHTDGSGLLELVTVTAAQLFASSLTRAASGWQPRCAAAVRSPSDNFQAQEQLISTPQSSKPCHHGAFEMLRVRQTSEIHTE